MQLTIKSLRKGLKLAARAAEGRTEAPVQLALSLHRVPTLCPRSLPAPVEMACPGYFNATEPPNPWQTVQQTFFSKLFILIQLREQGAESYNVWVHVQSPA